MRHSDGGRDGETVKQQKCISLKWFSALFALNFTESVEKLLHLTFTRSLLQSLSIFTCS